MPSARQFFISVGLILALLITAISAWLLRKPWPIVMDLRPWHFIGTVLLGAIIARLALKHFTGGRSLRVVVSIIALGVAIFATSVELRFHLAKRIVTRAEPALLQRLGQHLIVPCDSLEQVTPLVVNYGAGGIFLRSAFVKGRSVDAVRSDIDSLQTARRLANLPPLWVTADQEGGIVSRLSPTLPQRPSLAEIVAHGTSQDEKSAAVIAFARAQGRELADLGVNVNFAPVLDLNFGIQSSADKYSLIHRRAISRDPAEVSAYGVLYCQELAKVGIIGTGKHFPGIGRLAVDTHLQAAGLETPRAELEAEDWRPFRDLAQSTTSWIMVSHAKLMAVDTEQPASLSKPVITGILRQDWHCDSILVTDDICMGAITDSTSAAVHAINAGVDLTLIALDSDLYFSCLAELLEAHADGRLEEEQLALSDSRLKASR